VEYVRREVVELPTSAVSLARSPGQLNPLVLGSRCLGSCYRSVPAPPVVDGANCKSGIRFWNRAVVEVMVGRVRVITCE
jgi:hypothetical protein